MKRILSLDSVQGSEISGYKTDKNFVIKQYTNSNLFLFEINNFIKDLNNLKTVEFLTNYEGLVELRNKLDLTILNYIKKKGSLKI
jgi:hypothetical protein